MASAKAQALAEEQERAQRQAALDAINDKLDALVTAVQRLTALIEALPAPEPEKPKK